MKKRNHYNIHPDSNTANVVCSTTQQKQNPATSALINYYDFEIIYYVSQGHKVTEKSKLPFSLWNRIPLPSGGLMRQQLCDMSICTFVDGTYPHKGFNSNFAHDSPQVYCRAVLVVWTDYSGMQKHKEWATGHDTASPLVFGTSRGLNKKLSFGLSYKPFTPESDQCQIYT